MQLFENPEEVVKIFQAGGADSDLQAGGSLMEEEQETVWNFTRNYAVMLAPLYADLGAIPADSPLGQAFAQRNLYNGAGSVGGPPLAPGGIRMEVHRGGQVSGHYDSLYIGEPITRGATENTQRADQYTRNFAKFARREYALRKCQTAYGWSTEFVTQNIKRGQLNALLGRMLSLRMMQDFEDLAINGDADIVLVDSPRNELRRINDGWVKLTRANCPRFSAGGEYVEWALFKEAASRNPDEYATTGYKWWGNNHLWHDWLEYLTTQNQGADMASMAMAGIGMGPLGFPFVLVPTMPRDLPMAIFQAATSARVVSERAGGYSFPTDQFQISINIDGAGAEVIVFPHLADAVVENRYRTPEQAAEVINSQYAAAQGAQYASICRVTQHGFLEIVSPTAGAASSVTIAAPANSALTILGLTAGVTTGEAAIADPAPGTNTVNEGSLIWFAPAWNFVWHVSTADPGSSDKGLRTYVEFDQGADQYRVDVYSWQDATIQTPEATIVVENVRIARPGVSAINP